MKLTIENYEVEIKAKAKNHGRANKEDVICLLNLIDIAFSEAAEGFKREGLNALYESYKAISKEIYIKLEKEGCYKDL